MPLSSFLLGAMAGVVAAALIGFWLMDRAVRELNAANELLEQAVMYQARQKRRVLVVLRQVLAKKRNPDPRGKKRE